MIDVKVNTKGIDQVRKAFKGDIPVARVGILGDSNTRKEVGNTNAVVGASHEFGTTKLPRRSFLRMPISMKLQGELDEAGALDPGLLKEMIRIGSLSLWVRKLGITCEKIVGEAFATGGFGLWKPSNMRFKKNHQTLVETQQLRESIRSDVV